MTSIVPEAGVRDVERAILMREGEGESGVVTAEDVAALRRVGFPVGHEAAQALFDIAHATATADNHPAFAEFFAEAIGEYLARSAFASPERRAAFLSALDATAPARAETSKWADDVYRRESEETERRVASAADIDAGEAKWALAHLLRGGELSPAEKRLIEGLHKRAFRAPYERAA